MARIAQQPGIRIGGDQMPDGAFCESGTDETLGIELSFSTPVSSNGKDHGSAWLVTGVFRTQMQLASGYQALLAWTATPEAGSPRGSAILRDNSEGRRHRY